MKYIIVLLSALILNSQISAQTDSDNTEVNERDRSSSELTADQQSGTAKDMNITQRIRQDLMDEEDFSTYAQNVKIITMNGKVTLKGPVRSVQEQRKIIEHARKVAGSSNVKDEMSVVVEKE